MLNLLLISAATALTALAAFPTQLVYQSPSGLLFENLAVRSCGKLLLTSVLSPTLHTLDPAVSNGTLEEVYTFPNGTSLTGIVEYQPDVYAVIVSSLDLTTRRAVLGTSAKLWRLELTSKAPAATPIAVVDSKLLNGLSAVPGLPDLVLAADSDIGAVYSINMRTGAARIALQDAAMAAGAPTPALGINGLRARDGALYFTNSEKRTFARVALAAGRGGVQQGGAVRVLGTTMPATSMYDDFAMDSEGRAWVATPPGAVTLLFPRANGTWGQELAAGDPAGGDDVFMQPSSGAFGRAERTEKTLYVTTGGGQVLSVNTGGGDV